MSSGRVPECVCRPVKVITPVREEEGGGGRRRRRRAAKKKQNHHRGEEKHNQIRGMFGDGMANGEQGDAQANAILRTQRNALNTTHEQFRSQWRVAARIAPSNASNGAELRAYNQEGSQDCSVPQA